MFWLNIFTHLFLVLQDIQLIILYHCTQKKKTLPRCKN